MVDACDTLLAMGFDLREFLAWERAANTPELRRIIVEWTEQEPTPEMRFAAPVNGHRWLWELLPMFAPHSMPDRTRCTGIDAFSAPNTAQFEARHAAWLAAARPDDGDRIVLLLRDNLIEMSWDEYTQRFAPLAAHCVACTPDLRWISLGYFDEFIACFRPRWDAIRRIEREKVDQLRVHFTDPKSTWETNADATTLAMMTNVLSQITGLDISEG